MTQFPQYWIRTATGLEKIVLQEIRQQQKVDNYEIKHRSVFLSCQVPSARSLLRNLRTADDVYVYLGRCKGIDRTKASIDYLATYFEQQIIQKLTTFISDAPIRVTVSFLGKRNFNRFYVEAAINTIL